MMEREGALYVDLVNSEGELSWWAPYDIELPPVHPPFHEARAGAPHDRACQPDGLAALRSAWAGFDAHVDSHCSEWTARTEDALQQFSGVMTLNHRSETALAAARSVPRCESFRSLLETSGAGVALGLEVGRSDTASFHCRSAPFESSWGVCGWASVAATKRCRRAVPVGWRCRK